jgi:hypothetical protein
MESEKIDIGDTVLCDLCNEDFTNSKVCGGYIFETKAVCPNCAERFMISIKRYNETRFIKSYCPDNMPFADFVRHYRGDDHFIEIVTGD